MQPTYDASWPESWRMSYGFDLQEVYGRVTRFGYTYAYENRRRAALTLLREVLKPGAAVLDVAAAQGNFSIALAEQGFQVTWNDLRAELVGYVELKAPDADIRYRPGNIFELAFETPFDAVLLAEVIEHVAHPDQLLTRVAALVRPGGYVVMTTPNGAYFRNALPKFSDCCDPAVFEAVQFKPDGDGHIFLLHPSEIRDLAEAAGLEVDSLQLLTNPLTQGHLKSEWLLRLLPKPAVLHLERVARRFPEPWRERVMVHAAARLRRPAC